MQPRERLIRESLSKLLHTQVGGTYIGTLRFSAYIKRCALGFLGNPRIGRRLKRRRAAVVLKSFEGTTKEPERDEDGGWILEQIEIHRCNLSARSKLFLVRRMRGDGRTEPRVTQIFRDRASEKRSLPIFAQQWKWRGFLWYLCARVITHTSQRVTNAKSHERERLQDVYRVPDNRQSCKFFSRRKFREKHHTSDIQN